MPACIIKSCRLTSRGLRSDKPRFHIFPPVKNPRFHQWLSAIGMTANEFSFVPSWRRYICSNHFTDDSYKWHLLDIPVENRKLREDAVPNLQPETIDKHFKPFAASPDESSSESEYETEFESESEYESEYESMSNSEFSSDLDVEVIIKNPIQTDHFAAIGTRPSNFPIPRKDNSQKQVLNLPSDTSTLNWPIHGHPHGDDCLYKFEDATTQSDGKLPSPHSHKRLRSLSPVPGSHSDANCNEALKLSYDLNRCVKQDHRYSMQVKNTIAKETFPRSKESRPQQAVGTVYDIGNKLYAVSVPASPNTVSGHVSKHEPVECNESIDGSCILNYEGYTPQSLVSISESGELLSSNIMAADELNDAPFHENSVIYNSSLDSNTRVTTPNNVNRPSNVASVEKEWPKSPFADNFLLKREYEETLHAVGDVSCVGISEVGEFAEDLPFNKINFVNVKMECNKTNICTISPEERDEPNVVVEENGANGIFVKSEPVDRVDSAERKYVVYETCLLDLLRHCLQCGATVTNPLFSYQGSVLTVTMMCAEGHKTLWKSQP